MKIAIVGLGVAARTIHIPAFESIGLEIVGGHDPAARAGDFRFPILASVPELLSVTKPDILVVATPPQSHAELTRAGLEAGCHIFCEKPFVETIEQADELIAIAARAGRHVFVNNQYRFMPIHRAAQACIGTPDFGALKFVAVEQTFFTTQHTETGWRGAEQQRTVKEFGTHVFDLCRFFFGENPLAIRARLPRGSDRNAPDHLAIVTLEFSGDRVAQITLDRLTRGRHRYLDIRLDGSNGTVETSLGGKLELTTGVNPRRRRPFVRFDVAPAGAARLFHGEQSRVIAREPRSTFAHATAELMRTAIEAMRLGRAPPCSAADNRHTLELLFAAYRSAANNETVHLGPKVPG